MEKLSYKDFQKKYFEFFSGGVKEMCEAWKLYKKGDFEFKASDSKKKGVGNKVKSHNLGELKKNEQVSKNQDVEKTEKALDKPESPVSVDSGVNVADKQGDSKASIEAESTSFSFEPQGDTILSKDEDFKAMFGSEKVDNKEQTAPNLHSNGNSSLGVGENVVSSVSDPSLLIMADGFHTALNGFLGYLTKDKLSISPKNLQNLNNSGAQILSKYVKDGDFLRKFAPEISYSMVLLGVGVELMQEIKKLNKEVKNDESNEVSK